MFTKEIIDQTFINRTIWRGVSKIYDTQADIVHQYLHTQSGRLSTSFARRNFYFNGSKYVFPVVTYLRFLDIHYRSVMDSQRRNMALYNRVIWGVLYGETLPSLRYDLTEKIRKEIGDELREAGSQLSINW